MFYFLHSNGRPRRERAFVSPTYLLIDYMKNNGIGLRYAVQGYIGIDHKLIYDPIAILIQDKCESRHIMSKIDIELKIETLALHRLFLDIK